MVIKYFGVGAVSPTRQLNIGPYTIFYDGEPTLSVIGETRTNGVVTPMCYAILGQSGGVLTLPGSIPVGTELILNFASDLPVVFVTSEGTPGAVVSPQNVNGLVGANSAQPIRFVTRSVSDTNGGATPTYQFVPPLAITVLPGGLSQSTLHVHVRDGKVVVGER